MSVAAAWAELPASMAGDPACRRKLPAVELAKRGSACRDPWPNPYAAPPALKSARVPMLPPQEKTVVCVDAQTRLAPSCSVVGSTG